MSEQVRKVSVDADCLGVMVIALRMLLMRLGEREAICENRDMILVQQSDDCSELVFYTDKTKNLVNQIVQIVDHIAENDPQISARLVQSFDLFCYEEHGGQVKKSLDAVNMMYPDTLWRMQ
jgi:hypothetical protein